MAAPEEKAVQELSCIEDRIESLEKIIYGGNNKHENIKIADICKSAQDKFEKISNDLSEGKKIWTQAELLSRYLSHDFLNKIEDTDAIREDVITLADQNKYEDMSYQLEEMSKLKHVVSADKIAETLKMSNKLLPLIDVNIEQEYEAGQLSDDFMQLLTTYNQIMTVLSEQFVRWDNSVTHCENVVGTIQVLKDDPL